MESDLPRLPIGQVARNAGANQTVPYYERRGLIAQPARRPSGQRIYDPNMVQLLRAVKTAQRLGFTLSEIDTVLRLAKNKQQRGDTVHARMREKIMQIDEKIADLDAMRERLIAALHAGCDSLTNCVCPSSAWLVEVAEHTHR